MQDLQAWRYASKEERLIEPSAILDTLRHHSTHIRPIAVL